MAFSHHDPCPICNSRDNLGVYTDGSKWCFGCGHRENPDGMSLEYLENELVTNSKGKGTYDLPIDFTHEIPKEPYLWLRQYELSLEEISNNNIGWSQRNSMLIFPYFGEENQLLLWQGRYFPKQSPKVFTRGYPERSILLPTCQVVSNRIVVVEDPVSAIKVSRYCQSTPLFGASLSKHKAILLSRIYSHLTFWLDYDKIDNMVKFTETYRSLYDTIDFICTENDPKEVPDEEIKEKLYV